MRRLTARFLLLFALLGSFAPLALAATAPAPACCIRKSAHPCHGMSAEFAAAGSLQLSIQSANTCSHDCCRAANTSQWANPQQALHASSTCVIEAGVIEVNSTTPVTGQTQSQSTRAPPQISAA
jgi:hypothetical protein